MGTFHVFVEGPIDEGPEGVRRLAEAMHQRYGLLTSDVIARLSKGRFRVKGNVDEKTASTYARDLEAIGARATVEPSDGSRDKSGLINLPPVESGRSYEPTPAGGLPRSRATSGAPSGRPSSQKIGPVIERTKQPHDDRRDQLSPRIAATTKAPLGVDRPAAASNPPPLSTAPSAGRGGEPMPSAGAERLGDRPSNVALGAAGPSNAGIAVPRAGVDLDLGAPGGHGDVARRNQAVEAGDIDLGAPGATIPPRYTPVPANAIDLGASGAHPVDRASLPESARPTPSPRTTPVPLGAPGAGAYPTGPDGAPLPPRTMARNDAVGRTSMPPPVRTTAPPPVPERTTAPPPVPERAARPTPPPLDLEAPRHHPTPPPPPLGPPSSRPSPSLPPPPRQAVPGQPARPYASGLSAAYSNNANVEQPKDLHLALAALDHNAEIAPPEFGGPQPMMSASIGPPAQPASPMMMPASIGPAMSPPARPTPPPPGLPARAHDPFAPPDAHEQEMRVDLAPDERPRMVPRPSVAPPTTPVLQRKPVAAPRLGATTLAPTLPRWHFAAGVAASIILGFIPAHLVASMRESSADKAIDEQVIAEQSKADTLERYNALDSMRAAQESRKKSEHRNIALVSLLIWAAAGAGVGYVWFRKVPWDRVLKL